MSGKSGIVCSVFFCKNYASQKDARSFFRFPKDTDRYNKLSRHVRELARKIKELDAKDPFRTESSAQLLEKLYMMGLIPTKWDLSLCDKVNASCFCRRRLPVIMMKSKMCGSVRMATKFVQQGHVRVGSEVVKDPAFLVTRNSEDFVTWVNTSAIRRHIMEYNEMMTTMQMDLQTRHLILPPIDKRGLHNRSHTISEEKKNSS
ncbi:U3 small nucleolar ribonucleoprotein protein IMP3 isoform X2 [Periplaneta americana]|uniref:U3 small nucleolar ribonucleoprotein protein IMP3 isoform X2 n=1 Tax=Periplaneta americana TaxID=6978 RepID=UPI0037E7B04E